jgi:hypothetical protein
MADNRTMTQQNYRRRMQQEKNRLYRNMKRALEQDNRPLAQRLFHEYRRLHLIQRAIYREPKWKVVKLNNPPKYDVARNNFNNKDAKAVKVSWTLNGKKFSDYYTPKTVAGLMGIRNLNRPELVERAMSLLYDATNANEVLFEHPKTRANVRRKNLEFVRLEKRTNENKAATKIQAAFRGGRERQKTLNKLKRTAALITKKRKRN